MSSGINSCKSGNFNEQVVLGVKCRCKRMEKKCYVVKRYWNGQKMRAVKVVYR
jgi:hypothetical protein